MTLLIHLSTLFEVKKTYRKTRLKTSITREFRASHLLFPTNVRTRVAIAEVIPALPRNIRSLIIVLLAGWETTYSLSLVVNPVPE